ncbi:MAG TPA: phage integrase N-terminal SAM-like domain-containing protein [Anaerolineae bacterium]|nr:phage integrase N-terminal SAM-like domain-containing protein [Anaerolineae bacterium]
MTALRQKMIEDMQLRGLSERTQETYVRMVRQLAEYYHKPPDQLSQEELWLQAGYLSFLSPLLAWAAPHEPLIMLGG